MRRRKPVVHVDVAERRQLAREGRVVLFLAGVEAGVLEQQNVAGPELRDRRLGGIADAILRERDRPPEHVGDRGRDRRSDCFGSRPLGRPKCESRITLPPLSAISRMVGAARSIRVASETLPFSIGTLRSTRTSTRLPLRSA